MKALIPNEHVKMCKGDVLYYRDKNPLFYKRLESVYLSVEVFVVSMYLFLHCLIIFCSTHDELIFKVGILNLIDYWIFCKSKSKSWYNDIIYLPVEFFELVMSFSIQILFVISFR